MNKGSVANSESNYSEIHVPGSRIVKNAAKRAIKQGIKKLAKLILKVVAKAVTLALKKLLIILIGAVGIPVLIAVLAVVAVGSVIYLAISFDWFTPNEKEKIDIASLQARYANVSVASSEIEEYRIPVWLLQTIDNVVILKHGKEREDINPEAIAEGLNVVITSEVYTDTVVRSGSSGTQTTTTERTLTQSIVSWDRTITYEYKPLTSTYTTSESESYSGSKESGGSYSRSTSSSDQKWLLTSIEKIYQGDTITTNYSYGSFTNTSNYNTSRPLLGESEDTREGTVTSRSSSRWYELDETSSDEVINETSRILKENNKYVLKTNSTNNDYSTTLGYFGESHSSHKNSSTETTTWVLSKETEIMDFSMLKQKLIELEFTQSDFELVSEAIKVHDPDNYFIQVFNPSFLMPDDNLSSWTGGSIELPDHDFISGEWGYPSSTDTYISSPFGYRIHPITGGRKLHKGIDIARNNKQKEYTIYAAKEGKVTVADESSSYGIRVKIDHGGGYVSHYAHLKRNSLQVKKGDQVVAGQALGIMGATGNVTGVHLHFEIYYNGVAVDPMGFIRKPGG